MIDKKKKLKPTIYKFVFVLMFNDGHEERREVKAENPEVAVMECEKYILEKKLDAVIDKDRSMFCVTRTNRYLLDLTPDQERKFNFWIDVNREIYNHFVDILSPKIDKFNEIYDEWRKNRQTNPDMKKPGYKDIVNLLDMIPNAKNGIIYHQLTALVKILKDQAKSAMEGEDAKLYSRWSFVPAKIINGTLNDFAVGVDKVCGKHAGKRGRNIRKRTVADIEDSFHMQPSGYYDFDIGEDGHGSVVISKSRIDKDVWDTTIRFRSLTKKMRFGTVGPDGEMGFSTGTITIKRVKYGNPVRCQDGSIGYRSRWFMSVPFYYERLISRFKHIPETIGYDDILGFDMNAKDCNFVSFSSDDENIVSPLFDVETVNGRNIDLKRRLINLQKKMSRQKGFREGEVPSKRFLKTKAQIMKLCGHTANRRMDWMHKTTRNIVDSHPDILCIATQADDIRSMVEKPDKSIQKEIDWFKRKNANKKLRVHILKQSHSKFRSMLKDKAEASGKMFVEVDKYVPTTQTCHHCGYVKQGDEKMKLGDDVYVCPNCGGRFIRDKNAALNMTHEAMKILHPGTDVQRPETPISAIACTDEVPANL